MTIRHTHGLAMNLQQYLPRVAALLATLCAVCALLYGVFLLEAVAHAAARQNAERKISSLTIEVSDLQARYLASTEDITPDSATALGFVAPKDISTVAATPIQSLTLR